MTHLVVLVVSIAVVDSLNPTTIVVALYVATGPHPVRSILGLTAGYFAFNLGAGVVVLVLGHKLAGLLPRPGPDVVHWGELALGLGALLAAGLLWNRRHQVRAGFARVERVGHRFAPLAGATLAAIELPTAVPYFATIALLTASHQTGTFEIALLVVFNVIFLAPVVAIAIVRALAGGGAVAVLTRLRSLVVRHAGTVFAGLSFGLGVALVALGAVGLATSP